MRYLIAGLMLALVFAISHQPAQSSEVPTKRAKAKAPAVKAYVKREDETACLKPVAAVGSQWVDIDGAEESAKKAWMEAVRWHHGESYIDIARAKDYRHRCSRSSIGEAIGQVMHRCEVMANPCKPTLAGDK